MALNPHDILDMLATRGPAQYGREAVSQLEHALQCAQLAEQAGEAPATVVAALLHDLGHLLAPAPKAPSAPDTPQAQDDLHQYLALPFLRPAFPDAVLEPIRLHVDAKRYLCAVDPGYWDTLSPASKHSLELQGGVYSVAEAARFADQPLAQEAVRLRRYDDLAKVPGLPTPDLAHYAAVLQAVALPRADAAVGAGTAG
ncbi:MAG: HD domain-containing protein [Burkholderiaceae bacterium]|nr:HD domain-containing protein [Burkholderiaceae bacterium]